MLRAVVVVAALVTTSACKGSESAPPAAEGGADTDGGQADSRVLLVPKDHALYARSEGLSFDNACSSDGQCFKGGCAGEVCTATSEVAGTCEALPAQIPAAASCGCVAGACQWWSDGSASLVDVGTAAGPVVDTEPPPGVVCGDTTCAADEQCLGYVYAAGRPQGVKLYSCELLCAEGKCPAGKKCVTIADGPGPVCR